MDDFNWDGSKWVLAGVVTDEKGNYVSGPADNSSITGKSWGPGALKLKDVNKDGKLTQMTVRLSVTPLLNSPVVSVLISVTRTSICQVPLHLFMEMISITQIR